MSSTSETGHPINVANFEALILLAVNLGVIYIPARNNLQIASLTAQHTSAKALLDSIKEVAPQYIHAVNQRIEIFKQVGPLSTRLINALDSTEASDLLISDARTINRKLQGGRKNKKDETPLVEGQPLPTSSQISVSQQSFIQKTDHFKSLCQLIMSEPSYTPNETDLQSATLLSKITELESANTNVSTAAILLSNARIARNQAFYDKPNGLVPIANEVKKYVKSIFGATSPQYKQFSALKFTYGR